MSQSRSRHFVKRQGISPRAIAYLRNGQRCENRRKREARCTRMDRRMAFGELTDQRAGTMIRYRLADVVTLALCALLAGADDWVEVTAFGEANGAWLQTWLDLPYGVPSHDTFGRIFAWLDPQELMAGFTQWVQAVQARLPVPAAPRIRAIDGKESRRSHDRLRDQPALQEVRVWASETRLILANQAVDTKSNEITAIPLPLRQLDVHGCLVTIDAMGCQTAIAQQILDQGADYVLAVKDHQLTLHEEAQDCFAQATTDDLASVVEVWGKDHGRVERRRAAVITDAAILTWVQEEHHWPGLQALGRIESERRWPTGAVEQKTRYYVLSAPLSAAAFQQAVRLHWGIENQVHWVLDMVFREDASRVRVGHGAENLTLLRRLALNLLRQDTSKASLKVRRKQAGWDRTFLLHLLSFLAQPS